MNRHAARGVNKEKLIFVSTVLLLGASLYHSLASRPAELVAGVPVTSLGEPGPVAPEKRDRMRVSL